MISRAIRRHARRRTWLIAALVVAAGLAGWLLPRRPAGPATDPGERVPAAQPANPTLRGSADPAPPDAPEADAPAEPTETEGAAPPRSEAELRTLDGHVVDEAGHGIEGVGVVAWEVDRKREPARAPLEPLGHSDFEGRFRIRVPMPRVFVQALPGKAWYATRVELVGPDQQEVTLRLRPATSVGGVVLGPDDRPVPGATVLAENERASVFTGTTCGDDGRFEIRVPVDVAELDLTAKAQLAAAGGPVRALSTKRRVRTAEAGELTLRIGLGGRVEGEVLGPDGEPVERGSVQLVPVDAHAGLLRGAPLPGHTNRFVVEDVEPGVYWVKFHPQENHLGTPVPFRIEAPALGVRIQCPRGLILRGSVVGENVHNMFVTWARRSAAYPGEFVGAQVARPGGDGSFEFTRIADGDTVLYVYDPSGDLYGLVERPRVPDDGLVVHLQEGRSIEGRVVSPDGGLFPVGGCPQLGVDAPFYRLSVPTERDGTFRITGLPPGTYQLLVRGRKGAYVALGEPVAAGTQDVVRELPR